MEAQPTQKVAYAACSLCVHKAPRAKLLPCSDALSFAAENHEWIHVMAHRTRDAVTRNNQIILQLESESIELLTKHYNEVRRADKCFEPDGTPQKVRDIHNVSIGKKLSEFRFYARKPDEEDQSYDLEVDDAKRVKQNLERLLQADYKVVCKL